MRSHRFILPVAYPRDHDQEAAERELTDGTIGCPCIVCCKRRKALRAMAIRHGQTQLIGRTISLPSKVNLKVSNNESKKLAALLQKPNVGSTQPQLVRSPPRPLTRFSLLFARCRIHAQRLLPDAMTPCAAWWGRAVGWTIHAPRGPLWPRQSPVHLGTRTAVSFL